MNSKTIVIAAGGTGGHLYPGIALASVLRKRGCDPVFFVRMNDSCREILEHEGFPWREIPAAGLPRTFSLKLFSFPFRQVASLVTAARFLEELRPACVVGMGGYISFPAVLAGRLKGIPTIIHEQNSLPGLANRTLAHIAGRVAVSFENSMSRFPSGSCVLTGNPVRPELFTATKSAAVERLGLDAAKKTVFIFGGSLGAQRLNRIVAAAYPLLGESGADIQFLHVAGKNDAEAVAALYREGRIPGSVLPYLHTIGDAYAAADLIICRAGATTVAELAILGKPAILVPFPFATADHQIYNARVLADRGFADVIREKDLTPELLAQKIRERSTAMTTPQLRVPQRYPQELLADLVCETGVNNVA